MSAKRSWRKAHFGVNGNHIIESAVLNDQIVDAVCAQITVAVEHITADKMYDTNAVYQTLEKHFPDADIIIPPKDNTFADDYHHSKRMNNLIECFAAGIMNWQKRRNYGRRNVSETAMQRYKKILGNKLHSRSFSNQNQEMLLGFSILNHLTHLGMPNSYRVA